MSTITQQLPPPLPKEVQAKLSPFSEEGRSLLKRGFDKLDEEQFNKEFAKQILRSIAHDMKVMMDKHLKKMKEMHRDLMR